MWWDVRYQSIIAAVLILIQATLVINLPVFHPLNTSVINQTAVLCLLATIVGIALIKGLGRYPGVAKSSYTLVGLAASYGLLILTLLMLRVSYSRFLIGCTFVTNLLVLSALYTILPRWSRLTIGVVPEGQYRTITVMPMVEWRILERPDSSITGIDAVSVDLWSDLPDAWERRLADFALESIPVYDLRHLKESLTGKVEIEHLSENTFGTLSPFYAWVAIKQITDWTAALAATLLLLPFFAIAAVLIKLDSPGPVLFCQTRVGYRGRAFKVYKLRTMTDLSETASDAFLGRDAAVTKEGDQRITRAGRFLRRTRVDELPQLINVLKGEMSWIGPRPEAKILSQWYEQEIPFYRYRHIVRPGITGWAQVNQGHVADIKSVTDKLHFDFYYIKHFSPWIDFVVVARTIKTMMTGHGAR